LDEVIWYATSMPGDAQSIQLKRHTKTRPRPFGGEARVANTVAQRGWAVRTSNAPFRTDVQAV
jgi:hypothetical protein